MASDSGENGAPALERGWSNVSTASGSSLQLTSRLLIVTPFDDPQKISRYRERVSHSISRQSSDLPLDTFQEVDEVPAVREEDERPEQGFFTRVKRILTSREELGNFLTQSLYFQLLVVLLVSVIIVIVIIVDLQVTSHNQCTNDADCPKGEKVLDSHEHIKYCTVDTNKTKCAFLGGYRKCILESTPADVDILAVLHYIGLAILSLFVLEVFLRIFALRREFFRKKLEVFDGILVVTSIVFYAAYKVEEPFHAAAQGVALIILLRVWRMKRIVNGITTNAQKRNTGKRKHLQRQLKAYQDRDSKLCTELNTLKEEVRKFRFLAEHSDVPGLTQVESSM